jgi:filamentous hemagglutinin
MTKPLPQLYLLLPLVFITWWTLTFGFNTNKGNYQAVTNQTNLNGDGKLTVNVAGNTHLKGVSAVGALGTDFTTGTLTTEDIENKANYNSMGAGIGYSSANTNGKDGSFSPTVAIPQDKSKHSTTQASLGKNTNLTITNQAAQTQNVSTISKGTKTSNFTMTEINTEVLEIRADISKEVAVDGFEAVGDYAMKQKASGDKEWEDGGTKKTIAHAAMGAIVAGIGEGDALDGAAGAGAREAASNLSAGKDDTTQWISSAIGGVAGGAAGASVALQGENIIDNFIKKR